MLDGGQCRGLVGGDQRAGRHAGAADPAGDRRIHAGERQIDARGLHAGLAGRHIRFGLAERGGGVVALLLADRLDLHQFLVAVGLEPCGAQVGLRLGQGGLGAGVAGAVGGRVDLVQGLPCLHVAALGELPRLHDAAHLGPYFGDQVRHGAAGHLGGQGDRLGPDGDDADHRRALLRGRPARRATAGADQDGGGNGEERQAKRGDRTHGEGLRENRDG